MRIVGVVITIIGSVFLCGGSAGLMDGDPAGLILWMPGALLMILGLLIINSKRERKKSKPPPPPNDVPTHPMAGASVSDQGPCPQFGSHNRPSAQYRGQSGLSSVECSDDFQLKDQLPLDHQAPLTESKLLTDENLQAGKWTGVALGTDGLSVDQKSQEMNRDLLQQGVSALKVGQEAEACRLLKQVVRLDPRSEHGWLWLSGAVDRDEQRRFCLLQVLSINRRNAIASRGLEKLGPGDARSPLEEQVSRVQGQKLAGEGNGSQAYQSCSVVNSHSNRFRDQSASLLDQSSTYKSESAGGTPPTMRMRTDAEQKPPVASPPSESRPISRVESSSSRFTPKRLLIGLGALIIAVAGFLPWAQTIYLFGLSAHMGITSGYGLFSTAMGILALVLAFAIENDTAANLAALALSIIASFSAWSVLSGDWRGIIDSNSYFGGEPSSIGPYVVFVGTALVAGSLLVPGRKKA